MHFHNLIYVYHNVKLTTTSTCNNCVETAVSHVDSHDIICSSCLSHIQRSLVEPWLLELYSRPLENDNCVYIANECRTRAWGGGGGARFCAPKPPKPKLINTHFVDIMI